MQPDALARHFESCPLSLSSIELLDCYLGRLDRIIDRLKRSLTVSSAGEEPAGGRAAMSGEDLERLFRALRDGLSSQGQRLYPLALEALKDLSVKAATYAVEEYPDIMALVVEYATRDRGDAGYAALEILYTVFTMAPDSRHQPWAKELREKGVALCGEPIPPTPAIAWQLVRLLAVDPEAGDVESLEQCITEWSPQLYSHASPVAWATALYKRHPLPVRAMLDRLLETGTEEVQRRVREILAAFRSVDHELAREEPPTPPRPGRG